MVETDYLEHYGRLGMKWGQHIFGRTPTQYYEKGAKKIQAYSNMAKENREKAKSLKSKYYDAQLQYKTSRLFKTKRRNKAAGLAVKSYNAENKAIRFDKKAIKLASKMKELFSGIDISGVDKSLRKIGESYAKKTIDDVAISSKKATDFINEARRSLDLDLLKF